MRIAGNLGLSNLQTAVRNTRFSLPSPVSDNGLLRMLWLGITLGWQGTGCEPLSVPVPSSGGVAGWSPQDPSGVGGNCSLPGSLVRASGFPGAPASSQVEHVPKPPWVVHAVGTSPLFGAYSSLYRWAQKNRMAL